MLKVTFCILLLIGIFFWIADTTITFKPFKISLASWQTALGWILLFWGISLMKDDVGTKKYHKGYQEGVADCVKAFQNVQNQKNEEKK